MPVHAGVAVTLQGVSLGYGGKPVVENVSGVIAEGDLLAAVGPNGAGKSTLLKALAGLHRPMAGIIAPGTRPCPRPAYMPQHSAIDQSFPMSVLDFVAMGLWHEIGFWRPVSRPQLERVRVALSQVGLAGNLGQRIGTLSGGQLRRALFARASLQDASLILLDEPFAGIDDATAADLLDMIRVWHAEGRTVVAALHDIDQVRAHFPRVLLLAGRVIGWGDTRTVLTEANLATARAICSPDRYKVVELSDTSGRRADV